MLRHVVYKRNEKDFATKVVEDDSTGVVTAYVDDKAVVTSVTNPVTGGIGNITINGITAPLLAMRGKPVWSSHVPGLGVSVNNAGFSGVTSQITFGLPSHFDAIKIPVVNWNTAQAEVYNSHCVSVTGDLSDPVNGGGTWVPVLFSGSASVSVPAATTVNGRVYPGVVLSDPVYISSVERTDGGSRPLLCVRSYKSTANCSMFTFGGSSNTGWGADVDGLIIRGYKLTGDFVSSNHAGMTTANTSVERGYSTITGVVFKARTKNAVSILAIGDSLTKGTNAEQYGRSWTQKILSKGALTQRPVTVINAGTSGATTYEMVLFASTLIPIFKPNYAIYPVFTPNEEVGVVTAAGIAEARKNLVKFLDLCAANDVVPILWTGAPRSTGVNTTPYYSQADDERRVNWIGEAVKTYGEYVVDTAPSLSTAQPPYAYSSGMTMDGLHPGSSGDSIIASIFGDLVNRL